MTKKTLGLLLLSSLLLTAGCDKAGKMAEELQQKATQQMQEAQDEAMAKSPSAAVEKYINCENRILSMVRTRGSVEGALAAYKKQKLAEATPKKPRNPGAVFYAGPLKDCVESLTEANKANLTGEYAKIGEAGKNLLPKTEAFLKTVEELDNYLKGKAYVDDDFKRGRELDPIMIQQAEEFITAFNQLSEASTEVEAIRNRNLVKNLKANKRMRRAYVYEAYGHAQEFLTIATSKDTKDPAVSEKLSDLIKSMNDSLSSLKEEMGKVKDKESSQFDSVSESLHGMLGDMRECKIKNYSQSSLNSFIDDYNRFVQFTLNMGFLTR